MRLYLASTADTRVDFKNIPLQPLYILETFYSGEKACLQAVNRVGNDNFLLDSGAFTFMNSKKNVTQKELEKYIENYIAFIKKYNIKNFFELDIDVITGYEKVKKIRKYIEDKTGKKTIPVWHISRGIDDYVKICKEYSYIAIGGFVVKEITRNRWQTVKKYVNLAHKYNTKVHGLGFTPSDLIDYNFDSVDSTSWKMWAIRGKNLCCFDGKNIVKKPIVGNGKKINMDAMIAYSFNEWVKYQYYLNGQKFKS